MRAAPVVALTLLFGGRAVAAPPQPKPEDVCTAGSLDRQKLASVILDGEQVSRKLEDWAAANPDAARFGDATPRQRLLVDDTICERSKACSKDDLEAVSKAQQSAIRLLADRKLVQGGPGRPRPILFFTGRGGALSCQPQELASQAPTSSPSAATTPAYVRGTIDALVFSPSEGGFKAADKATLSFSDDDIAHKQSTRLVGYLGVPLTLRDRNRAASSGIDIWQVIPFAGGSYNSAKVTGKARATSTDTVTTGTVLTAYSSFATRSAEGAGAGRWQRVTATPEVSFNRQDDSRVFAINLTYMPGWNGGLNSYRSLDPHRPDFLSYRPILDFRWDSGVYLDRGARLPTDARDFTRIGTQFGLTLSSDMKALPADLTVTETFLGGLEGLPRNISQLKSTLSLYFEREKNFGVDLSYVKGRKDDFATKEEAVSIALGIKY